VKCYLIHIIVELILILHHTSARKIQGNAPVEPRLVSVRVQLLPLLLERGPLLRRQPLVRIHAVVVRLVVDDLGALLTADVVLEEPVLVGEGQLVGLLQGLAVPVLGSGVSGQLFVEVG
jgi:hypothetical protein